jgi:hypothetical protein
MKRCFSLAVVISALAVGFSVEQAMAASGAEAKGKTCTMEQQCRFENFKKICTWVKVCR